MVIIEVYSMHVYVCVCICFATVLEGKRKAIISYLYEIHMKVMEIVDARMLEHFDTKVLPVVAALHAQPITKLKLQTHLFQNMYLHQLRKY